MEQQPKFGARVYLLASGKILVKQTVKSDKPRNGGDKGRGGEYVVDKDNERHASWNIDAEIADAIRGALEGKL